MNDLTPIEEVVSQIVTNLRLGEAVQEARLSL